MTLLRNCRVVDVRKGLVQETSVAIEGSKIVSLGDPKNTDHHSIDLEGAYLLPGLVNCHVHHVPLSFESVARR
jgi:adenine deaminase